MHYANGQEAKLGDLVVLRTKSVPRTEMVGTLVQASTTSTSCNGQLQAYGQRFVSDLGTGPWMRADNNNTWCVTIGELLPVEFKDLAAASTTP